jgi:hypothetical protein
MNVEQITPTIPIASLVESRTLGEGTTIIIGKRGLVPGYVTVSVPDRLLDTAFYVKSEYSKKYKLLIDMSLNASAAVDVAFKTASGLYDSNLGKITDNIYDLPRSDISLMVLRKDKSQHAFETAAYELAREIQAFGSLGDASRKLAEASGEDLFSCAAAIASKDKIVAKWFDKYSDNYTHEHVTTDAPLVYMQYSVTKARQGFRAMLKLPTGFGKTSKLLNPAIQSYLDAGKKVLVISHRRSIIKNITVPGLVDYEDVWIGQMNNAKGLKIVVNSLISAKFDDFLQNVDLVVIDEAAQVIDHTLEGSVRDRDEVWIALRNVVQNAKSVIFADADANDECLALLKKDSQPVTVFEIDQAHSDIKCKIGALDQVRSMAINSAKEGHKVLVAVDIAKDAEAMGKVLEKAGINPLVITSKTAGWPAQSAFIANPNTDLHNVVIYSPAITSALSITSGHFTRHYGLFEGSVTPRSAIQMLRRDRKTTEFVIGVRNPQAKRQEIAQVEYDASSKSEFDNVRFKHMIRTSWLRDNIQFSLPQELRRQGFELEKIENDDAQGIEGWKSKSSGRRAVKTDTATLLLHAQAANELQATRIKKNGSNSEQEHFAAIRFFAEKALKNPNLTFNDCSFWGEGVGQVKLNNFRKLYDEPANTFDELAQELYDGHLHGQWQAAKTADLYQRMNDVRHEAVLAGYEMPKQTDADKVDPKTKQATLTTILKMHGLKTKRVDGGKSGYYYVIDLKSLEQMQEYTGL